jgi:hypothetical protein
LAAATNATATAAAAGTGVPACVGGYCFDDDPCTIDRCDATVGGCVFEPRPNCGGCTQDADCDDHVVCNDVDWCRTCAGCWLHEWNCCASGPKCKAKSTLNGVPCNDFDRCESAGTCEDGTCQCTPRDCATCNDGDPCTNDECDSEADTCAFVPVTGDFALICGFQRPAPFGEACANVAIPSPVAHRWDLAYHLLTELQGTTSPDKRHKLLVKAERKLRGASSTAAKLATKRRPKVSLQCTAQLSAALEEVRGQVLVALAQTPTS